MLAPAFESKLEKGAGSPKDSCQAFGTHCAQGTFEPVIQPGDHEQTHVGRQGGKLPRGHLFEIRKREDRVEQGEKI
jgi:hypothetical protein